MVRQGILNIHETADIHPSVILEGNITIGAFTTVDAGSVLTGNITIGHHSLVRCNVTIRGTHQIGNFTHIYDNVCMEGGRPAGVGGAQTTKPDRSIIGDNCWINHGATMHGARMADRAAVGLNASLDYNTRLGEDSIVTNGSATCANQVVPPNTMVGGVPAVIIKENITADDRTAYFGVDTVAWTRFEGADLIETRIRRRLGI